MKSKYKDSDREQWKAMHKAVVDSWPADLTESIVKNMSRVHPVSTMVKVTASIYTRSSYPCVLKSSGVSSVINMTLTYAEVDQLKKSADTLWGIQKDLRDLSSL
uniref:Lactate/malate dehydrogenase C-terminal domain-containing protein n=1 Tax=Periophthalmus magnuspinnatus TaxID=409849 RepID=A0A3B3ZH46_9GOBI